MGVGNGSGNFTSPFLQQIENSGLPFVTFLFTRSSCHIIALQEGQRLEGPPSVAYSSGIRYLEPRLHFFCKFDSF